MKDRLLWLDDAPQGRSATMSYVAAELGLHLELKTLNKDYKCWEAIVDGARDRNVMLIIVDQCLTSKSRGFSSAFEWGSSLCGALKIQYPSIPIVGTSAAGGDIDEDERDVFTDFINLNDLRDQIPRLRALMEGFKLLRGRRNDMSREAFLKLLKAPKDISVLDKIIPQEFVSGDVLKMGTRLYKWFRDVLFRFQGVLVDVDMIAATTGVEVEVFRKKVAPKLATCLYDGIFAQLGASRYWRDKVFTVLADMVHDDGTQRISHYVDYLPGCKKAKSICPICNGYYTEIIANEEVGTSNVRRYATHRKCAEEAKIAVPSLFDPIYVLLGGN